MADADLAVLEALLAHLKDFQTSPAVRVAWPNRAFAPPATGGWIRPTWLPAQTFTTGPSPGSSDQFRGVFQISVFWQTGDGPSYALEIAGQLVAHFQKGTVLYRGDARVVVSNAPYVSQIVSEPSETERMWIGVPVNVPYFASGREA